MKLNREEETIPEPEPEAISPLSMPKLLSLEERERERRGGGDFRVFCLS